MIYSPKTKPDGTIRDWLNYHAEKSPDRICYQFSDNSSDLTWSGLLKKVISISAGVDLSKFNSGVSGEKIRDELMIEVDEFLVGKIGVIRGWKGHNYFLEAIPFILKEVP